MIRGVRLCEHIGWTVFDLIRDNASVLEQVPSFRAKSGLHRQNRHILCLFYVWQRLRSTLYLSWVPGDLNPADCLSRIDSEWFGDITKAESSAMDRFHALGAYESTPSPIWILGFPKGPKGAFRNFKSAQFGGGCLRLEDSLGLCLRVYTTTNKETRVRNNRPFSCCLVLCVKLLFAVALTCVRVREIGVSLICSLMWFSCSFFSNIVFESRPPTH